MFRSKLFHRILDTLLASAVLIVMAGLVEHNAARAAEPAPGIPTRWQAQQLADVAEQLLAMKRFNCIGGVRTVAVVNEHTVDVICGYSNAYRIDFDAQPDFVVTRLEYPAK